MRKSVSNRWCDNQWYDSDSMAVMIQIKRSVGYIHHTRHFSRKGHNPLGMSGWTGIRIRCEALAELLDTKWVM